MPPKRKRNETASDASGNRPSPHRPSDTTLGQHDREGGDGRRRSGAGGRNTRGRNAERRSSLNNNHNHNNTQSNNNNNRGPISPSTPRPPSSSSQVAPQSAIATPLAPPAPPTSQAQPRPPVLPTNYNYIVLKGSIIENWKGGGRKEVVDHGISSRDDEDIEEISTISQEFARAVLENRLDPTDAGKCIEEILGPDPASQEDERIGIGFDAHSLFVDSISILADSEESILSPPFRDFVLATGVSPQLLRGTLDPTLLNYLGLIRNTFGKMGIRYSTNLLYRQSNYNLLREESEGFAKLITELYWTAHSLNQEQLTRDQVEAGFERIKGLIGTFDLDVGRVLDIVFDVFASTMMRTFRYFTMFLRASSWWPRNQSDHYNPILTGGLPRWAIPGATFFPSPEEQADMDEQRARRDADFWTRARKVHIDAFFELGGRQVDEAELERYHGANAGSDLRSDAVVEWIQTTRTLPPPGSRVAAQIFGFKLQYYTSSARERDEIIPANLFYLAAYLIKVGFLSLPDLYAHLWPSDDKMDGVRQRRVQELEEKEKKDRQGVEPNALLKAGALPDDTAPATSSMRTREATIVKTDANQKEAKATTTEDETLPEPKEVLKVDLVQHLLLVGAIPEALFMLGRFPWLIDAYPEEIISSINRILLHSVEKVYQETRPKLNRPVTESVLKRELDPDQSGVPKGNLRLIQREQPKTLKWPHANGFNRGTPYEHYLKEWSDTVPVCQTVDDLFTLCSTLLNVVGVNIGKSPTLLKKLTAIGAKSLAQDQSQQNLDRWQDLIKRLLLPALNLTASNVDVVDSVWSLLNHYPTHVRYNIYAECYEGQVSRLPAMAKAFKNARLDTLAILKRLSKENITKSAKHLAKVALFSPGVVCKVALDQIEAYSNLIEAFVDCARYFTDLGYDILVWSLMSSLGGKQRSRTQEGSVLLTSKWLQALSKFSGKVFRRYSNMDPTPLIQYVNDQLAHGNSTDLVILREFITSMGGIVSDVDFTDVQLAALSGGEELRKQTFINLGDKRFESGKSASRLMQSLFHMKLAPRLLTNIAHYRQTAIYQLPENEAHIKYLATVIDDSQQALVQYVELLRSKLSPEEFDALVPGIPQLMTEFGLDANLAFLIGRVSLAYFLTGPGATAIKEARQSNPREIAGDTDGDISMDIKDESANVASSGMLASSEAMSIDSQDSKEIPPDGSTSTVATKGRKSDHFLEVLRPIIETVQLTLPPNVCDAISPEFYVLFWALQTGDLGIPASSYNAESIRLQKELEFIKKDRSDMTRQGRAKAEQRKADISQLASKLGSEATDCQERVSKTKLLLLKSASTWIPTAMSESSAAADMLIEACLVPRMLLSPGDADFCYKMIKFLHDNQVAHFNILILYDRFFSVNRLRTMIFGCTVREAEFLGRFIKLTLGDLARWHKSRDVYEREATKNGKHPAFLNPQDVEGKPSAVPEHDHFRDQLWSWHQKLATALKSCLQGTEWMHIRNAITILKAVLDHFPAVDFQGRQLFGLLQKIAQREGALKGDAEDGQSHRVDLSVTATTAASALKKHEPRWVMVQAFRTNTAGDTSDDKTPEGKNVKSLNLRATAPEFKPHQKSDVPARVKVNDDEDDGEVEDLKSQAQGTNSASETRKDLDFAKSANPQRTGSVPPRPDSAASVSRPSTPSTRPSNPSSGPNPRSQQSKALGLQSLPPGLPSRPDVPVPGHFTQNERGQVRLAVESASRPREVREPRDSREAREPREPRESRSREPRETRESTDPRSAELTRPSRGRESFGADRRPLEPLTRESPRSDRDRPLRQEGHPRWEPPPNDRESHGPRDESRDRAPSGPLGSSRISDPVRPSRDLSSDTKTMPPPGPAQAQGPPVNPQRAALIAADRPEELINPERAALIHDGRPVRSSRDDSRDRGVRLPSPPRRDKQDPRPLESSRDDRSTRSHRSDYQAPSRDSRNEPIVPAGPRSNADRLERPRDLVPFQGSFAGSRGEHDHRLSNQDPNYGRLNPIQSSATPDRAPDAPRGRGSGTPQAPSGPGQPPRPDPRYQSQESSRRGASPDRNHPPSGPASSRSRRGPMGTGLVNPPPLNTPPAGNSPVTAVHPDRARHLNPGPGQSSSPSQPGFGGSSANSVPVHPDRMNRIDAHAPQAGPPLRHGLAPLQTPERPPIPTGPQGRQSSGFPATPSADNNVPMTAPTGPAATNDRSKTGSRRQLAGINNLLQGSHTTPIEPTSRNGSLRGRSSRTNLAGSDAQVLTGASPVSTPAQERTEPFSSERGDHGFPRGVNGDDRPGRGDRERSRRHHEHGENRSSRSSRQQSRERSPGREVRAKTHGEFRDRESGAGLPNASTRDGERDSSRRSGRDIAGSGAHGRSGEAMGHGRGEGGREPRHRGEGGSSGRHEDYGRSGGAGRGASGGGGGIGGAMGPGGSRMDDHRLSRDPRAGGEDGGRGSRKRRSEEGTYSGQPPDAHKRQRQR